MNHDQVIQLALHLSFDAKVNDKDLWRAIEDNILTSLHHLTLTQVCQLEWASMELKPKHTTPRLNTLLQKKAIEAVEGSASAADIIDILQGFRQRKNKDMYQRVVK